MSDDASNLPSNLPTFEIVGTDPQSAPCDGVVSAVPSGHRLLVDGQPQNVPANVRAGQLLQSELVDRALASANSASTRAVAEVIQKARREPVYLDYTVRPSKPRHTPPPPDTTVSKKPIHVRLGGTLQQAPATPPPSPQKAADQADGAPIPDGVLSDADVLDLAVDLGGGPSDADIAHAQKPTV